MTNHRCYLSKSYPGVNAAGSKAKCDIEAIMSKSGIRNIGLPQVHLTNKISAFLYTLRSVLKMGATIRKGDELILQYPFKKYYSLCCYMAHHKGAKVTTIVHDLGSFRRKKLTVAKEIKRLSGTDKLIVHNQKMNQWLQDQGFKKPMVNLEIFDYLSTTHASPIPAPTDGKYQILYAGGLAIRKSRFLYELGACLAPHSMNLYGNGFDANIAKNPERIDYLGFIPSDKLIASAKGHFGLVWDGDSLDGCTGEWGHYLQYNNPHKTSLYIRCQLPLIIWEKAALADFVKKHQIGLVVKSLNDINTQLNQLTTEDYLQMKNQVEKMSQKLASGYFVMKAINTPVE